MSDVVLELTGVSKTYRIYASRFDRVLDAFGLFRFQTGAFEEIHSVIDVSMAVTRGERVGIVGRNGAGKSTLLKMIAGTLPPTSGTIAAHGKVHALLELGTGFHPDLSGFENIRVALAYHGVTGAAAARAVDEIMEFVELDDFLSMPVKTYSSGMYARLAFAIGTAVSPDVLIVDEALSAGDAYFAEKCAQRIGALTARGATLLLVSHDMSLVHRFCDRAVWLDRGRVEMSGDVLAVSKAYAAQVRSDEERQVRARALRLSRHGMTGLKPDGGGERILFHLIGAGQDGAPLRSHRIRALRLRAGDAVVGELLAGTAGDNDPAKPGHLITTQGFMNWGPPERDDVGSFRRFGDFQGRFAHAPFVLTLATELAERDDVTLELVGDFDAETVTVERNVGEGYVALGSIQPGAPTPVTFALAAEKPREAAPEAAPSLEVLPARAGTDRYGSGEVEIERVDVVDESGRAVHLVAAGTAVAIRLAYRSAAPVEGAVAVVAGYRSDGSCAFQLISSHQGLLLPRLEGRGVIEVHLSPMVIGRGEYALSVALFKHLSLQDGGEPPAYDLHDRRYLLRVVQPEGFQVELGAVLQPGRWAVRHVAA